MKKGLLLVFVFIILYLVAGNIGNAKVMIPDEAIRLRVIPNSNSEYDQNMKSKVKDKVQLILMDKLKYTNNIEEVRMNIKNNLKEFDKQINSVLIKENYKLPYQINYGYNYFPQKEFNGVIYNEGMYESLVVTLGSGAGDNWWCVLFPPLCLLEAEESEDVEYKFFVKEIIEKYL